MLRQCSSIEHLDVVCIANRWFEFRLRFHCYLQRDDQGRWYPIGTPWVTYVSSKELPLYNPALDNCDFPP